MTDSAFEDSRSLFLWDNSKRAAEFKRNEELESLLSELKQLLAPIESDIEKDFQTPTMPPLFVVGNPRSGTTVLMQFLSSTGQFAVPTNLLSRFYYAPYLGARIQQLLTDPRFDYKGQLTGSSGSAGFSSNLGNSTGPLAPHEFTHFWRRFLPNYDLEYMAEEQARLVDWDGLLKGIAAIEYAMGKPLACKAFMMQYNLNLLPGIFEKFIVLYVERSPLLIMQSILEGRQAHYGTRELWWSVKPKEYVLLKNMDVYHQIAGQVYFTELAIAEGMETIPESNGLVIRYEQFCDAPSTVYHLIREKYAIHGYQISHDYLGPTSFKVSNKLRLPEADISGLMAAYDDFKSNRLALRQGTTTDRPDLSSRGFPA